MEHDRSTNAPPAEQAHPIEQGATQLTGENLRLEAKEIDQAIGFIALEHTPQTLPEPAMPKQPIDRSGRKPKDAVRKSKGGKGHFSKQIKSQLTASGKLNATPPMPPEQKRARRKKRKR